MAGSYSTYEKSYNAFAGVDIVATFAGRHIGELQGISFTSTREIAPLYTMGAKNPRSFAKGKRGIAGSLIFLVFDRESLIDTIKHLRHMQFVAKADELRQQQVQDATTVKKGPTAPHFINSEFAVTSNVENRLFENETFDYVLASPMYYDEIPPFTIVLNALNEAGHTMRMHIKGVQIMNAGSGTSIDDMTIDTTCTFVATEIIPWHKQGFIDADGRWQDMAKRSGTPLWGGSAQ